MKLYLKTAKIVILAAVTGTAGASETLNVYNWSGYFSPELIKKFKNETGIDVRIDSYDSNETLLAKLSHGSSGYDVAIATHGYMPILIEQGMIEPLNMGEELANTLVESLRYSDWDPEQRYSLPYVWGTTGFTVNTNVYDGNIDTYQTLFDPPEALQGQINMFANVNDVIDQASIYLDIPLCSDDPDELQRVLSLLEGQKPSVKTFSSKAGSIRESLLAGEIDASMFYSGSSMRARENNEALQYAYPHEGVLAWVDNFVIPEGAPNAENARRFIAYLLQPENAAINTNYLGYQSGVQGVNDYVSQRIAAAPEMKVPEGRKLVFSETCSQSAIRLRDRVWTNLMQ